MGGRSGLHLCPGARGAPGQPLSVTLIMPDGKSWAERRCPKAGHRVCVLLPGLRAKSLSRNEKMSE